MMRRILAITAFLLAFSAGCFAQAIRSASPKDNGKALVNPFMGWEIYYYSNTLDTYGSKLEPEDTVEEFEGAGVVFFRLPWAFIEPEKDKFNWEIIDSPAQRWIDKGYQIALLVTSTEHWTRQGTPQWVFDEGARYYEMDGFIEPEYNDKRFLEAVDHFVMRMAERYDGDPKVAYVGIGHFGMWGEGHTVMTTPIHGHQWGFSTKKKYIDIYTDHFRKTQLVISDDIADPYIRADHFKITDYAFKKGVSLRDDSILVEPFPNSWYHDGLAQQFWPTMPVVLEHQHYGSSVEEGAWDKELLLQSIEDYHASYMSIHWYPHEEYASNKDIIKRINQRLGYRLQLETAQWPAIITAGQEFTITSFWKNAGVAPCYKGGYPCFTIKNDKGGIVAVLVDSHLNVKDLQVEKPGMAPSMDSACTFNIGQVFSNPMGSFSRTVPKGEFQIYFSVGEIDGTPVYNLPYEDSDGHKRYLLGNVIIQ